MRTYEIASMMETFLKTVAKDLFERFGTDLSRVAVVFPNKRAGLFFNEALAELSDRPVWSPAYLSISDLFRKLSDLKVGDPIKLVCELYKVFRAETGSTETMDDFYFWGELLIGDFDDVDKNRVDSERLFANLSDLKNIMDGYDYLSPEQEEAIRQFFQNFSIERRTVLKERFISLWNVLGNIYHRYREALAAQGIAYEGMLYRKVIERLDPAGLPYDKYVFVGFNVLNKVETKLFEILRDADKAIFYWDYDTYYLHAEGHEAGEFIRRNLRDFPSSLPEDVFDSFSGPKQVRFIAAPTENAEALYLQHWIRESQTERYQVCAVVLCNESLLQPVLHSVSPEVKNINVTMGFPLSQTPVYSFISVLMDMQAGYRSDMGRFTYASVIAALKHPYSRRLTKEAELLEKELTKANRFYPLPSELQRDDVLKSLFGVITGNLTMCDYLMGLLESVARLYQEEAQEEDALEQLYRESLFKAYTTVTRFRTLVEEGTLVVGSETFRRLLNKVLSALSVPFHGEPAIGMQIMGVLETRNLDFRNVIMLSLNEGQLPKAGGDSSFIPYNLRKAFGMTTIEHKNAVYAYYFYRLMQRAENITLLYNTSSDGLNRGEQSRFMLQYLLESPHDIIREYLEAGQSPQAARPIVVEKTPAVMQRLQSVFDRRVNNEARFSPSALNTYMDCRLKFYYRYVARLRPLDEVSAEIDSAMFGKIFHHTAELIYKDLTVHGKRIRKEDLETLLRNEVKLQDYVDTAFKELFFQVPQEELPEYNGVQLINSSVITSYIKQLLRNDLAYAPFDMVAMELPVVEDMDIQTPKGVIKSRIGGIIDRMDSKGDTLRIVDYKTGGSPKAFPDLAALFTPSDTRPNYVFQTFLYAAIMQREQKQKIAPSLLYIHRAASEDYSPVIEMGEGRKEKVPVDDFSVYEAEFRELLDGLLSEIFNPEEAFSQTEFPKQCEYCDFKALCRR